MNDNINSADKSEESNQGSQFSEDINKIEDQSNGVHVHCVETSAAETSVQSVSIPSIEGGETANCNPSVSLAQKKDDLAENDEVIDEDESMEANQKKKRLKLTELSVLPTTEFETIEVDKVEHSSLDPPVECELVIHSCSTSPIEKSITSEEIPKSEKVFEDKLLGEVTPHYLGDQNDCPNNDDIEKSNGNRSEVCDAENDVIVNSVSSQSLNGSTNDVVQKKLLVLDVNGLLLDICSYVPYDPDPDDIIHRKAVFKRPYCDDFLEFCFEKFNVGVWTSRTKRNMDPLLDCLLGKDKDKLLFSWDQSHCTDTGFYTVEKRHKPLLLKKLKKLWDKSDPNLPWEKGAYNETNTLLLDDTPYKALSNPQYSAIFPNSYRFRDAADNSLGPGGDLRVYLEGLAAAENVQEYVKQNPFGQRAITERNLSWGYFRKVIEASRTPPRKMEGGD